MPHSLRIQYSGAYYHVMARGTRREAIFHDDEDRRFFLHTLGQACEMTGWRARLIWKKTTAGQGWIGKDLRMGSATHVSQQMRRLEKAEKRGRVKLPEALKAHLKPHALS